MMMPVGHLEKLDVVKSTGTVKEQGFVEQIKVSVVYTVAEGETYEEAMDRLLGAVRQQFFRQFRFEAVRLAQRIAEAARYAQIGIFDTLTMTIQSSRDDESFDDRDEFNDGGDPQDGGGEGGDPAPAQAQTDEGGDPQVSGDDSTDEF